MSLSKTLGDDRWLKANEEAIKGILPETWTHVDNVDKLKLGFGLKVAGIDYRTADELAKVMVFLEKAGFMLRDGLAIRRSPHQVM